MANMRNIAGAFLDGFGSLLFLFERAERPGSRDNLIAAPFDPVLDPKSVTEAVFNLDLDAPDIVRRLRKSADLIESRYQALSQAAAKPAGTAHGG